MIQTTIFTMITTNQIEILNQADMESKKSFYRAKLTNWNDNLEHKSMNQSFYRV